MRRASAQILDRIRRRRPAVTRDRLYLDMMQSVLGNSSKVLVDQKAGGNLLYLPLDKLMQQSAAAAGVRRAADAAAGAAARAARARGARSSRRARARRCATASDRRPRMKLTMPLLALVVAMLLVASQALYTVDQTQVRDQVPARRDHRDAERRRPVLQGAAGAERHASSTGAT